MIGVIQSIYLAIEPIDMRAGMERLTGLVQNALGYNPCDGSAYVFRNRQGTRIKLLVWDGNGVWLCYRRLHHGKFRWPDSEAKVFSVSEDDWNWLIMGVEWQRIKASAPVDWRV